MSAINSGHREGLSEPDHGRSEEGPTLGTTGEVIARDLLQGELDIRCVMFVGEFKGWNEGIGEFIDLEVRALRVGAFHIEQ